METVILITGANGQIGKNIIKKLEIKYGKENIIKSDITVRDNDDTLFLDILKYKDLEKIIKKYKIKTIIHLGGILSGESENNYKSALETNMNGAYNVLELSKIYKIRVFIPSSISSFGNDTPKENTDDITIQNPLTIYGITKKYIELLGTWYYKEHNVDFRCLRYPGIIDLQTKPNNNTTDYFVQMLEECKKSNEYYCYISKKTTLPMLHMSDCINGTIKLLELNKESIKKTVYNITGFSCTPNDLHYLIKKYNPDFTVKYNTDSLNKIANTWPDDIDDSNFRKDINWKHNYNLETTVKDFFN